jgi:phosphoribosyl-AMP cyclohydrolase
LAARGFARACVSFTELVSERIAGSIPAANGFAMAGKSHADIVEGLAFTPKFDADGLITAVATDAKSGDVLMVAQMNEEALRNTISSGEAWYYSRSRKKLWKKGETSGHVQRVVELRVDCDQDALWLKVDQQGPGACHTGRRSCFYRAVPLGSGNAVTLEFRDADKRFDPKAVYKQGR